MSVIEPFKAFRPKKEYAKDVASCAYDVVNRQEARSIARGNSKSFLHVIKSEIDLPDATDSYDAIVYDRARDTFAAMIGEGIFMQDQTPRLYIYRQQMGDHVQHGVVALVGTEEYEAGTIKRHELTRADKEMDRTRHIDIVGAQTGPVFMTYKSRTSIDTIVKKVVEGEPEYHFTADDGIVHTVWVIDRDDLIGALTEKFAAVDALYIADGHHRAASAATVAKLRRERNPAHRGNESYNRIMSVIFPHDQLKILPYHRIVKDLGGMSAEHFMATVEKHFYLFSPFKEKAPRNSREFGMYMKGCWYKLSLRDPLPADMGIVESLDVSLLENTLLTPILGIADMRHDPRIDFVGGIRGTKELEQRVDSGEYELAISLYPTDMNQLMAVSDSGHIMPPKSTWFEPKLRSGLFVHRLD